MAVQSLVVFDFFELTFDFFAFGIDFGLFPRSEHTNRPSDKVRIFLHDAANNKFICEVFGRLIALKIFQMKSNRCTDAFGTNHAIDRKRAVADRFPKRAFVSAGFLRMNGHLVGNHERGVETDTKLPNEFRAIF